MKKQSGLLWAASLLVSLAGGSAWSATNVWSGAASGSWTNENNWTNLTAPVFDDDIMFNDVGAGNFVTTLDSNWVFNSLIFNADATNSVTIGGNTLFLLGGIQMDPASTSHTISSTINVSNNNQTWSLNSGQTLTVGVVNDVNNSIITVSNGTVMLTGSGNVWQWNMVNGATLTMDNNNRLGDTATTVNLDSLEHAGHGRVHGRVAGAVGRRPGHQLWRWQSRSSPAGR